MAQTKKDGVREAILQAAFAQFSEVGYSETSIPSIAAAAGISTANVYRYFPSKLQILYTLYEPWLVARLDELAPRWRASPTRESAWRSSCSRSGASCRGRPTASPTT